MKKKKDRQRAVTFVGWELTSRESKGSRGEGWTELICEALKPTGKSVRDVGGQFTGNLDKVRGTMNRAGQANIKWGG